ncbi:MAG TPA: type II toxin-antitoxin system RelE/ParE family toxin [Verrucomicrobiae bacterium]|nr:type II toxin-antitoxin system RelE/ParE family toxin [Verrucomicrobiae bacterium]
MLSRPVVWHGDSLARIRAFPAAARRDVGYEVRRVQLGKDPRDWKPMSSVGAGAMEIRVRAGGEYRVFYVAKFREAVHVLHAFAKKSQKTKQPDIELAARRYRALVLQRDRS